MLFANNTEVAAYNSKANFTFLSLVFSIVQFERSRFVCSLHRLLSIGINERV